SFLILISAPTTAARLWSRTWPRTLAVSGVCANRNGLHASTTNRDRQIKRDITCVPRLGGISRVSYQHRRGASLYYQCECRSDWLYSAMTPQELCWEVTALRNIRNHCPFIVIDSHEISSSQSMGCTVPHTAVLRLCGVVADATQRRREAPSTQRPRSDHVSAMRLPVQQSTGAGGKAAGGNRGERDWIRQLRFVNSTSN